MDKNFEGFKKEELNNAREKEIVYILSINRFIEKKTKYDKILEKIKRHKFDNFKIIDKGYIVEIYPDDIFLSYINELNTFLEKHINLDKLQLFVTKQLDNMIDFEMGIDAILQGQSIGYKLYKILIKHFSWLSSDKNASTLAINLWYSLLQDDDLYCITSNYFSYAIDKNIADIKLKEILDRIIKRKEQTIEQVMFDNDLIEKITQIYGSFHIYTQTK